MLMRRRQLIELKTSVLSPLLIENSYKFSLYFISWSILASNYQSDQHLWIFLHTCYYRSLPFSSSWPLLYQATPTCHRKSTCTPNCRTVGCQTQSEISLSPKRSIYVPNQTSLLSKYSCLQVLHVLLLRTLLLRSAGGQHCWNSCRCCGRKGQCDHRRPRRWSRHRWWWT